MHGNAAEPRRVTSSVSRCIGDLAPAQSEFLRGVMELFLFHGGYGGFSLIEGGTANLCLVVRRKILRALGGWDGLLESMQNEVPALRERLHDAKPCWQKPLAISPIPYGHLGGPADGIWRIGDQAAVIPSFTGDGMSIALHSAALAAEMYLDGKNTDRIYPSCLTEQLRSGMRVALLLSQVDGDIGAGASLAPFLLSMVPGAMGRIALSTRIPDRALLSLAASTSAAGQSSSCLDRLKRITGVSSSLIFRIWIFLPAGASSGSAPCRGRSCAPCYRASRR